ncbi:N-acetylmuramoyl-L-alanine amidase [Sporosarcina sp. FSL K6-6792]|uniref:N-acetylmuramoyl-L-alanine amidase n=1 Tax=Sporosarcina sp. FSL K6-6792 TaxID=2921559 RepID=UPI00404700BE
MRQSGGIETLVQEITASKASKDIAAIIQPYIVQAVGLCNRGVKTDNLHMLRESSMPAILTEGGFMDSTTDIAALRSDAKLKAQGEAIADGLAMHFKLKLKICTYTTKRRSDQIVRTYIKSNSRFDRRGIETT